MITLGIDIGSRNTKVVFYDTSSETVIFSGCRSTEVDPLLSVETLINEALLKTGVTDIGATGCTGYGRKLYKQTDKVFSEISCHSAGVVHLFQDVRTVIDIGGQDSKIITVSETGKVVDFVMNDKCAAGTGHFLEMTALRLGCSLDELSLLAETANIELNISSTCVVFAESEIIGMIASHAKPADIARAVHHSVSQRIISQLSGLDYGAPIVFTGGVAQNRDLVNCLARELQTDILVPLDPEITGALGAAILVSR